MSDLERVREHMPPQSVAAARSILLALAELRDASNHRQPDYVRASVETVASYAGLTARTVYRLLPDLVKHGIVGYTPGAGKRASSWRIRPVPTSPRSYDIARPGQAPSRPRSCDMTSQPLVRGTSRKEVLLPSVEGHAGTRETAPVDGTERKAFREGKRREPPTALVEVVRAVVSATPGGYAPSPAIWDELIAAWSSHENAVRAIAADAIANHAHPPMARFLTRIRNDFHRQDVWHAAGEALATNASSSTAEAERLRRVAAAACAEPRP